MKSIVFFFFLLILILTSQPSKQKTIQQNTTTKQHSKTIQSQSIQHDIKKQHQTNHAHTQVNIQHDAIINQTQPTEKGNNININQKQSTPKTSSTLNQKETVHKKQTYSNFHNTKEQLISGKSIQQLQQIHYLTQLRHEQNKQKQILHQQRLEQQKIQKQKQMKERIQSMKQEQSHHPHKASQHKQKSQQRRKQPAHSNHDKQYKNLENLKNITHDKATMSHNIKQINDDKKLHQINNTVKNTSHNIHNKSDNKIQHNNKTIVNQHENTKYNNINDNVNYNNSTNQNKVTQVIKQQQLLQHPVQQQIQIPTQNIQGQIDGHNINYIRNQQELVIERELSQMKSKAPLDYSHMQDYSFIIKNIDVFYIKPDHDLDFMYQINAYWEKNHTFTQSKYQIGQQVKIMITQNGNLIYTDQFYRANGFTIKAKKGKTYAIRFINRGHHKFIAMLASNYVQQMKIVEKMSTQIANEHQLQIQKAKNRLRAFFSVAEKNMVLNQQIAYNVSLHTKRYMSYQIIQMLFVIIAAILQVYFVKNLLNPHNLI